MTVSETEIGGWVAPGFEGVRDAFAENFRSRGDKGASLGVYVDGEPKVDLWGGTADVSTGRPWTEDSVSIVYSATKGATAILAWLLAQRGLLDFDAPVARYWPEFAGGGKAGYDGSCGCRTAGGPTDKDALALAGMLMGLALVIRRRSRARA